MLILSPTGAICYRVCFALFTRVPPGLARTLRNSYMPWFDLGEESVNVRVLDLNLVEMTAVSFARMMPLVNPCALIFRTGACRTSVR